MLRYKYIAIEGNIGVGKTSLTKLLGKETNREVVLENFNNNTFLKSFYLSRQDAFQMEMSFLLDRYQQLDTINKGEYVLSDYYFLKTQIFAKNNLTNQEYKLFSKYFKIFIERIRRPDLLVFLYADNDRLIHNVRKRGRKMEEGLSTSYLNTLGSQYDKTLKQHKNLRIVWCDVTAIDFVANKSDFQNVLNVIDQKYFIGINKVKL